MSLGFYIIMAAQFFSSLADNALLVAAIALLMQMESPAWMTPLLKFFFTVSYVVFAAFVGAFADSMPKGRVMFITNTIKVVGCLLMFFSLHPLLAFLSVLGGVQALGPLGILIGPMAVAFLQTLLNILHRELSAMEQTPTPAAK